MTSIVIPAHNEAAVIADTLRVMTAGASPGEVEVIVVCNGCTDDTARIARAFGRSVKVIETEVGSKTHALNMGDAAASGFPRVYADADIELSLDAIRRLVAVLKNEHILAAAPVPKDLFLPGTSWAVRAYYRMWMALPYIQEGMMGAGVYAVNERGRRRFGAFPDIIADDGYVRLQFMPDERVEVKDAYAVVKAPRKLADLVRIKTRSRLGFYQLRQRFPELFRRETSSKNYSSALLSVLLRPILWWAAGPYLLVNLMARLRAKRQLRKLHRYVWERDDSSRSPAAPLTM